MPFPHTIFFLFHTPLGALSSYANLLVGFLREMSIFLSGPFILPDSTWCRCTMCSPCLWRRQPAASYISRNTLTGTGVLSTVPCKDEVPFRYIFVPHENKHKVFLYFLFLFSVRHSMRIPFSFISLLLL